MKSLNKTLEPFKNEMNSGTLKKLITVSSILMGIDALIICKDVCDLNNEETNETLEWALKMILIGVSFEEN